MNLISAPSQMNSFFVTGTDTEVGKTFVSIMLAKKYKAHYYKPIQAGIENMDANEAKKQGIEIIPSTYILNTPSSPHYAAKIDGIKIELNKFITNFNGPVIVEGAGGVMVPINDTLFMLDIIVYFNLPTIIVTRGTVGTINHTLLTINALKAKNINIAGVIINGNISFDNAEALEFYGKVKIIDKIAKSD